VDAKASGAAADDASSVAQDNTVSATEGAEDKDGNSRDGCGDANAAGESDNDGVMMGGEEDEEWETIDFEEISDEELTANEEEPAVPEEKTKPSEWKKIWFNKTPFCMIVGSYGESRAWIVDHRL
jgi:hypothetical protein